MARITCFKPTTDQWHSEFKIVNDKRHTGGFVHVSFMQLHPSKLWRVCVWGNDDLGMEFDTPHESNARTMFVDVCLMDNVTKFRLTQLGFVFA